MNVKFFVLYCLSATAALYSMNIPVAQITQLKNYDKNEYGFIGAPKDALGKLNAYIDNAFNLVICDEQSQNNGKVYSLSPECLGWIKNDFLSEKPANDYEIETNYNENKKDLYFRARIALTANDNTLLDPINNKSAFHTALQKKIETDHTAAPNPKDLRKSSNTTTYPAYYKLKSILLNKFAALSICLVLIVYYGYKKW